LQGRFSAVVVEDDAGWQEVARYLHLNPVRVAGLGLGKRQRAASRAGAVQAPGEELVAKRLERLRQFSWSSYRSYMGYTAGVGWLWRDPLEKLCGGRSRQEQRQALRQYTEQAVRQGQIERPWDRLVAGLVLGTQAFARSLCQKVKGNLREQVQLRKLARNISWSQIVAALEQVKGETWAEFSQRHGDWGRDAALWLGRKRGRYRLGELGKLVGGVDYAAVGQAVSRFGRRLEQQPELKRKLAQTERRMLNVEM
jgi:hypothetical protein